MNTQKRKRSINRIVKISKFIFTVAILISSFCITAFSETEDLAIVGKVYEYDDNYSHYEFHEGGNSQSTNVGDTYGTFYINGNIKSTGEKSGIPAYEVTDGSLDFFYNYEDTFLNVEEDSWHLADEKSKKVADIHLDSNIMKGAIIIQTSTDSKNWANVKTICNVFSDMPVNEDSIYSSTDMQLINGSYYRVIIVYKFSRRTEEGSFFFINTDKYDYRKYAEVYEFYAYTSSEEANPVNDEQTYNLGTRVRVKNPDGYFGQEMIDENDIHYGWDLGNFFVSGYTDEVLDADENVVFLKNVGDKVTLWFKLNQDINKLNGNKKLSVTADKNGYDQYFETPKMDFGRGALIVRSTDYNNVNAEPVIYTNYLEANTSVDTDTKVQLFEEGDYEIALDYEVTEDGLIFNKVGHYRIFFRFSVRNSNCMVYPFDVATGSELTNSSMTENGFRLDLAKSRYLKINIKREVLKDSADDLVEDTRFNGLAKDGEEYTEEGIYTITVNNNYTNQCTVKKIYVGTNKILKAHMVTGLSIPEINKLIDEGATISDDGSIKRADSKKSGISKKDNSESDINSGNGATKQYKNIFVFIIIAIIVCVLGVAGIVVVKKQLKKR